jgi:hypothetical protein
MLLLRLPSLPPTSISVGPRTANRGIVPSRPAVIAGPRGTQSTKQSGYKIGVRPTRYAYSLSGPLASKVGTNETTRRPRSVRPLCPGPAAYPRVHTSRCGEACARHAWLNLEQERECRASSYLSSAGVDSTAAGTGGRHPRPDGQRGSRPIPGRSGRTGRLVTALRSLSISNATVSRYEWSKVGGEGIYTPELDRVRLRGTRVDAAPPRSTVSLGLTMRRRWRTTAP